MATNSDQDKKIEALEKAVSEFSKSISEINELLKTVTADNASLLEHTLQREEFEAVQERIAAIETTILGMRDHLRIAFGSLPENIGEDLQSIRGTLDGMHSRIFGEPAFPPVAASPTPE